MAWKRQQRTAQVLGSLAHMWEIWRKLLASDFSLAQTYQCPGLSLAQLWLF